MLPVSRSKSMSKLRGAFDYTHALVRDLPENFAEALSMQKAVICLPTAKTEHSHYVDMVKTLVPHVTCLPVDQSCPDCCFIEDVLVVVPPFKTHHNGGEQEFPGMAIITLPGAASRQAEVAPIHDALKAMSYPLKSIHRLQAPATLDGGDVMFTGSELWVGLSHRTNPAAISQLSSLLGPACPVHAFNMQAAGGSTLHLKSVITAFDDSTLLVADNAAGKSIEAQACAVPGLGSRFKFVAVPDAICSNVLRIGKIVVMQKGFPKSEGVIGPLCKAKGLSLNVLRMGETAKADGALTCCSVLIHMPKPHQK